MMDDNSDSIATSDRVVLDSTMARQILQLPLECINIEYPNKLGQVLGSDEDLKSPKTLRPIFYGCFDWHSAVHGYWSIIKILKLYPELDEDGAIVQMLDQKFTTDNVKAELDFFYDENNQSFERTYGWAWFMLLQAELKTWEHDKAQVWYSRMKGMDSLFVENMVKYLPNLVYPIRNGQHNNTAFGLSLMLQYAQTMGNVEFENVLKEHAIRLFYTDTSCDLSYEPSGTDFLSPCLEEAMLMSKVLDKNDYETWLKNFLPQLFDTNFRLEPAIVKDRTDGHLVHLDGLNYSRAHCLNSIVNVMPELSHLVAIANEHIEFSLPNLRNDDYMGSHWLGTFALYTLTSLDAEK